MGGQHGYAGKILSVDLSSGRITLRSTTDYTHRFVGGRGIAAKVYWDDMSPASGPFDPENRLIFMTGPLAAIRGVAGARWQISGKSPVSSSGQYRNCSLGGRWGAQLKLAGYDGLIVHGKAEKPTYLLIRDGLVELRDAAHLWGRGAVAARELLKSEVGDAVSVVATGPAGEHLVTFANLLADNDASGSSGLGAVMGSKKLKAIAVGGSGTITVADPERLGQLNRRVRELKKQFLTPEELGFVPGSKRQKDYCYGCPGGCIRATAEHADGRRGKCMCQSATFYQGFSRKYSGQTTDSSSYANRLCDEYGLDTWAIHAILLWLSRCFRKGLLTEEMTGLPLSKAGSPEFIEALVSKISLRDSFGDVLAQGLSSAAEAVGAGAKELLTGYSIKDRILPNDPRVYISTALLNATEPRPSQSGSMQLSLPVWNWARWARKDPAAYVSAEVLRRMAERFFGTELAVDFSTYSGKALAAKRIQDRAYINESLVLCLFAWPLTLVANSADHVGDPSLESKIFSSVIGREVSEEELYHAGETVFNLERAILAREGHRNREEDSLPEYLFTQPMGNHAPPHDPDCLVPGRDGAVISRKGAVVDREGFERMKDEYYQLRGWDIASGRQTKAKLEQLGLPEVAQDLEQRGLVANS